MAPKPDAFSWVIEGKLAAMAQPSSIRLDLEYLKDQDISVIVGLTSAPLTPSFIEEFGFTYHHIPVPDFAAPTPEQIDRFVAAEDEAMKADLKVVVHCFAGRGRTGTMLACYLVSQGETAEDAIDEIRRLRPGSVETEPQERAVYDYEARRRRRG